jgi:hypothetical protein
MQIFKSIYEYIHIYKRSYSYYIFYEYIHIIQNIGNSHTLLKFSEGYMLTFSLREVTAFRMNLNFYKSILYFIFEVKYKKYLII